MKGDSKDKYEFACTGCERTKKIPSYAARVQHNCRECGLVDWEAVVDPRERRGSEL